MQDVEKIAVITGGASGVGFATVDRFLEAGYRVAALDLNEDLLIAAHEGRADVLPLVCDVSKRESVTGAMASVTDALGIPAALVNSAGTYGAAGALDVSDDEFDTLFRVNVKGTFLVSQVCARIMVEAGVSGSIVNMSSVAAFESTELNTAYSATKGAVNALTRGSRSRFPRSTSASMRSRRVRSRRRKAERRSRCPPLRTG